LYDELIMNTFQWLKVPKSCDIPRYWFCNLLRAVTYDLHWCCQLGSAKSN